MQVIAVYARASRDKKEMRVSCSRQLAQCVELAKATFPGVEVRTYEDNDLSAANPKVFRPDYARLIGDIRRGEVAQLVCHQQSRLTRQASEWNELVITLTKAGIAKVHTKLGGIVSVDEGNRLVGSILNLVDAEEVAVIRARVTSAHLQLATEGRPSGGLSYGYRKAIGDDGRPALVIEPSEAEAIRLIADRLIEGHSLMSICAELDEAGIPTRFGASRWSSRSVRAVVTKPAVAGLRVHKGVEYPGRWEPILSQERWRQVRRVLSSSTTVIDSTGRKLPISRLPRFAARRWLLTGGLARCGRCGSPMAVHHSEGVQWYRCGNTDSIHDACGGLSISPAEMVEELVTNAVLEALDNPKLAKRLLADPNPHRAKLLGELAAAEELMTEAAELRGAGLYDKKRWESQFYPAKARAESARDSLAAMADAQIELPPASEVRARWDDMPVRQRRALLERFIESVEILPAARRGRSKLSTAQRVDSRLRLIWKA